MKKLAIPFLAAALLSACAFQPAAPTLPLADTSVAFPLKLYLSVKPTTVAGTYSADVLVTDSNDNIIDSAGIVTVPGDDRDGRHFGHMIDQSYIQAVGVTLTGNTTSISLTPATISHGLNGEISLRMVDGHIKAWSDIHYIVLKSINTFKAGDAVIQQPSTMDIHTGSYPVDFSNHGGQVLLIELNKPL